MHAGQRRRYRVCTPGAITFSGSGHVHHTHPKFSSGYYLKLGARVAHFFGSKQTCAEKHNSNSKPSRIPINRKAGGAQIRPRHTTQLANLDTAGTGAQFYQRPARAYSPAQFARADVALHAYFMCCLDVPRAALRDQVECRLRRKVHTNGSRAAMQPPVTGWITLSRDPPPSCAYLGRTRPTCAFAST